MAFFKALGEMSVYGFVCNSYDENNNFENFNKKRIFY